MFAVPLALLGRFSYWTVLLGHYGASPGAAQRAD